MSALRSAIKAHLQLMRLSNAPTVISNVLVGLVIGAVGGGDVNWLPAISIMLGVLLLYAGGMIMNDVVDARLDRRDKPERPIPSGRITTAHAQVIMTLCLIVGTVCILPGGAAAFVFALFLLAAIGGYNLLHKRTGVSVVLMGACRGLVYLLAAAAVAESLRWSIALTLAVAMSTYIVAVTLAARAEAKNDAALGRRLSIMMILIALAPALVILPMNATPTVIAGLVAIGWLVLTQRHVMVTPPRVGEAVHGWLAAICLIDALYLCLLGWPTLAIVAWTCFAATMLGHRVIAGT